MLVLDDTKHAALMLLCGCFHDIAEKSKEDKTKKQLSEAIEKLEKILEHE